MAWYEVNKTARFDFREFLEALQIAEGRLKGRRSPVAVAKALHLLAPTFFPLWDDKIARAYGCYYGNNPADKYIAFHRASKVIADQVNDYDIGLLDGTLVKQINEFNYSKYTQGWI